MSLAGTVVEYQPSGFWWDGIPEEQWPKDEESLVLSNRIGMINLETASKIIYWKARHSR